MKKLISLLLAMMLCILPAASMAEMGVIGGADGPTVVMTSGPSVVLPNNLVQDALAAGRKGVAYVTVTDMAGINTGDPTVDEVLQELLSVLGFYVSAQGDEQEMAITISDIDVLNLGVALNGEDLYLNSNLLGDTIVVGLDEVEPIVSRLMDVLVLMGMMNKSAAAEAKSIMGETMSALADNMANNMSAASVKEEDLASLNFAALEGLFNQAEGWVIPIEEPVVPRNCDMAASGYQLTISNEDMLQIMESAVKFLEDNPILMDSVSVSMARTTGMMSMDEALDEVLADMQKQKLLDGDCTVFWYVDEDNAPVYVTCTMPLDAQDYTSVVEATYSRQTVAQGVSHVMNMTVEGETLTVDALVGDQSLYVVLSAPEQEPVILDAMMDGDALKATLTANPNDSTSLTMTVEGTYLCTSTEYRLTGEFTMTNVYTPADAAAPSLNGLTLPGFEAYKPKAKTTNLSVGLDAHYDRNDVDFNGVTDIWFTYDDMRLALQARSWTESPTESIMAGHVVRPAELDNNAFTNWFVRVVNNFGRWAGNLLSALPESLLSLLMYSGLFGY